MAITITQEQYKGKMLKNILTRARTGFDTFQKGVAYVTESQGTMRIPRMEVDNLIQDRNADPRKNNLSQGDFDLTEKELTPKEYMIYKEFLPSEFEGHWFEDEFTQKRLIQRGLPRNINGVVLDEILGYHDEVLDPMLWTSNATTGANPYNKLDGFMTKLTDGAAGTLTVSGAVALTEANVEEALKETYNALPVAIRAKRSKLKLVCSYATADLYGFSQHNKAYKSGDSTMQGMLKYNGIPVVPLAGVPDNTIIGGVFTKGKDSNLWIAFNSLSDKDYLDMKVTENASEYWYVKALNKVDVQIPTPEEVALYTV